jgi:hypothetical protein
MKNTNSLKSFNDLPSSVATQVADASSPTIPESPAPTGDPTGEDSREMLRLGATAPPSSFIPHHRWGLNE